MRDNQKVSPSKFLRNSSSKHAFLLFHAHVLINGLYLLRHISWSVACVVTYRLLDQIWWVYKYFQKFHITFSLKDTISRCRYLKLTTSMINYWRCPNIPNIFFIYCASTLFGTCTRRGVATTLPSGCNQ